MLAWVVIHLILRELPSIDYVTTTYYCSMCSRTEFKSRLLTRFVKVLGLNGLNANSNQFKIEREVH
jgi:hypothetical protein